MAMAGSSADAVNALLAPARHGLPVERAARARVIPSNPKHEEGEPMSDKKPEATNQGDGMQGEGNYAAARRFDEAERSFVKKGPIEEKAREAAEALDGPEGKALEAARKSAADGDIHAKATKPDAGRT
jgi:hypothetical protein